MGLKSLLGIGKRAQQVDAWKAAGAIIVDVRTPQEYSGGHVPGSINVPLNQLEGKLKKLAAMKKPVIAVCASGMRSANATATLKRYGIEAVNGGSWSSLR